MILTLWAAVAMASEPELRTLMERFAAHARVAAGYLRSDNTDLGAVELERLRVQWNKDVAALPGATAADPRLLKVLREIDFHLAQSLAAADRSDSEAAQQALQVAMEALRGWRRANGLRLFADCIDEIGVAYAALDRWRVSPPKLNDDSVGDTIVTAAAATEAALHRCDNEADGRLRVQPEFLRLVDGFLASVRQIPDAVRRQDSSYLHRLLIEQHSFMRLLAFRFG